MRLQVLDLDGAFRSQTFATEPGAAEWIDLADWGPRIRMTCSFARFRRFEQALAERLDATETSSPRFCFLGSGDFHHVSLALLRRVQAPCNLLLLDNHPDWMRGVPVMHCGTWLYHASRLPQVRRIFHVGGDVDFDNAYRWLAPWPEIMLGKIVTFPAVRSFQRGNWKNVSNQPVRSANHSVATLERLDQLLAPYREDLGSAPLYISFDKDVLRADEATVNWDSGHLWLDEATSVLTTFIQAAHGRLAGMDTVGDWSPVHVNGWLRRMMHWTEHPRQKVDPAEAARRNEWVNRRLLQTVERCREVERAA